MKRWVGFFVPCGVIMIAALLCVRADGLHAVVIPSMRVAPLVVFAAAVLLGLRFNRSSLVFAALVLVFSDGALMAWAPDLPQARVEGLIAWHSTALLVPLNLMLLCLMKERGVLTVRGVARMAFLAAQPLAIAVLAGSRPDALLKWLCRPLLPVAVPAGVPLSQPAIAAFLLALSVVVARYVLHRGAKESGFFWVIATVLAAFVSGLSGPDRGLLFTAAGLMLVVAAVETSHAMAYRDELTGLPARRALKEDLLKLGSRYTLAMLDIDHFKKFNDRYGHDVGDQVLRMVAARLGEVSGGGKAFRYGGEEFTVVFPGRCSDQAQHHLEELRRSVETSRFVIRGRGRPRRKPEKMKRSTKPRKAVSVTVSIGMASRSDRNAAPQAVLKAADKALYRAKRQGRNRLCA